MGSHFLTLVVMASALLAGPGGDLSAPVEMTIGGQLRCGWDDDGTGRCAAARRD